MFLYVIIYNNKKNYVVLASINTIRTSIDETIEDVKSVDAELAIVIILDSSKILPEPELESFPPFGINNAGMARRLNTPDATPILSIHVDGVVISEFTFGLEFETSPSVVFCTFA